MYALCAAMHAVTLCQKAHCPPLLFSFAYATECVFNGAKHRHDPLSFSSSFSVSFSSKKECHQLCAIIGRPTVFIMWRRVGSRMGQALLTQVNLSLIFAWLNLSRRQFNWNEKQDRRDNIFVTDTRDILLYLVFGCADGCGPPSPKQSPLKRDSFSSLSFHLLSLNAAFCKGDHRGGRVEPASPLSKIVLVIESLCAWLAK